MFAPYEVILRQAVAALCLTNHQTTTYKEETNDMLGWVKIHVPEHRRSDFVERLCWLSGLLALESLDQKGFASALRAKVKDEDVEPRRDGGGSTPAAMASSLCPAVQKAGVRRPLFSQKRGCPDI